MVSTRLRVLVCTATGLAGGLGVGFVTGWQYGLLGGWMLAAALLCMVLGSLTSYIRARAEGAGMTCTVGIAERADRLVIALADPLNVTSEFDPALDGVIAPEIVNVGIAAAAKLTPVTFDPVTETT